MTTRESRREEYNVSSNVVRTLNPSRPLSPYTQKTEFDNSLDYILDDLQQSVSRPGSSLGQPISNYSTHREVQYLNPINTTSISRERSMSPNTSSNKVYKTSKYEYSTSNNGGYQSGNNYGTNDSGNFSEINKLDTLLSDLEHERTATLDRNKRSVVSNNIGIDSGLLEPGTRVVKTTTTYTSKNPVQRELQYESPDSSGWRSQRHTSPGYDQRTIESTTSKRNISYEDNGLYGGINKSAPRRTMSPVPANTEHYITETSRTMTPQPGVKTEKYITETRTINNEIVPIPKNVNYNEVVRVENSTGPSALQDMQLSDDILPKPKTKVTTTVRTYTYEIPEPDQQTNSTIVYNQTNVSPYPDNDAPKNTAMFYKTERNQRSVNYFPNQSSPPPTHDYPNQSPQPILAIQEPPPQNSTTIYKYDVTNTRNTNSSPSLPPGGITLYPQQPNHTTVYKTETTNTTNKQYRSPTPNSYYPDGPNGYPNGPGGPGYPQNNGYSPANGYPPHQPHQHPNHQHPNEPSVIVYKTTTTNTTRNMTGPRPAEREPLLQPFPVDGPIITEVTDGNPPKRVEDLMASFGDTSEVHYTNKRVQIAEKPLTPTRMQNTQNLVPIQRSPDDNEDRTKTLTTSRNIAGPPVYYPPNHEMFSAKEEAAYRAQGGGSYARGSGKYMYESESKSKSSSKSGGAVVPVCLPLCCAMPCTIM